jgi:transposase-like protein
MDYHQNARLTVHSRGHLARTVLEQGLTLKRAAALFNVSAKTAAKWVRRYRAQGGEGLGACYETLTHPVTKPSNGSLPMSRLMRILGALIAA